MTGKKPCTSFSAGLPIEEPECFYGRQEQLERFFRLQRLDLRPLRVLGLRRSGKTSYLKHLSSKEVLQEWLKDTPRRMAVAYVDAAKSVATPRDFYLNTATAISQAALDHLGWTMPEVPGDFSTPQAFDAWLNLILKAKSDLRLVVLIDELEALCKDPEKIPASFWGHLRSLASKQFTWVTASFIDLHQLGIADDVVSPFWNIFHHEPIMIGPLETQAARALVADSAEHQNILFDEEEFDAILQIAGSLPYFIQAVLEKWLELRKDGKPVSQCREIILKAMLRPSNQISRQFNWYWEHFSVGQRSFLNRLAQGPAVAAGKNIESDFEDYGLVYGDEGTLRIAGELFQRWLESHSAEIPHAEGAPSSPSSIYSQSGGVTINAGTVNITGDVTGRDKGESKRETDAHSPT
jgi:hypothetical protein